MYKTVRFSLDGADAYDALHDVVEKILSFDGEILDMKKYTNRMIRNAVADFYRKAYIHKATYINEEGVNEVDTEREALGNEALNELVKAIKKVSNKKHRKVLRLALIEDEDYGSISKMENVKCGTIRVIINRFRKRNKDLLDESRR